MHKQTFELIDETEPDPNGHGRCFARDVLQRSVEKSGDKGGPRFLLVMGAGISVSSGMGVRSYLGLRHGRSRLIDLQRL